MTNHILTVAPLNGYTRELVADTVQYIREVSQSYKAHNINVKGEWVIEFDLDMTNSKYNMIVKELHNFAMASFNIITLYSDCPYKVYICSTHQKATEYRDINNLDECKHFIPNVEPIEFDKWEGKTVSYTFKMKFHKGISMWIVPLCTVSGNRLYALPVAH